jgi:hypothetical protein
MTEPTPDRDQIIMLARHTGLDPRPSYLDESAGAYAGIRRILARIPSSRPRSDEPAHVFAPATFAPCNR